MSTINTPTASTVAQRISALRERMIEHGMDAYLVPSTDPHQSEYVADRWQARAWLSGFDGSAGTLIVTPTFAGLWTDSRYFLQAERQLIDTGIQLQRLVVPHTPEYLDWLVENLPTGATLGFDGGVVSVTQAHRMEQQLAELQPVLEPRYDLINNLWADRPLVPASPVVDFAVTYAGSSSVEKCQRVQSWLEDKDLDYYLFTQLDDIAWLLNIRAQDVGYNPVCVSYLVVGRQELHWFCGPDRITDSVAQRLQAEKISLYPYSALRGWLGELDAATVVGLAPAATSLKLYEAASERAQVHKLSHPVSNWKATKNATELAHLREVMKHDGVALLRLRRYIDQQLQRGESIREADVADVLITERTRHINYRGESFPAIVGYGANGAIIHYHALAATSASLAADGLLLLDSGGQYLEGTTDVTRTFALGAPTADQRRHFTLVLRGHIGLARAQFPAGTSGAQLDILARLPLWEAGLNYGHGTGHGVGFYLNVHEGPQSISPNVKSAAAGTALQPGMVTSNEPGYYRTGEYGIRIENLIVCVTVERAGEGKWLAFETLTLFPIDRQLIETALLSPVERAWLNDYHQRVLEALSPLLNAEERAWLTAACAPL